LCYNGDMKDFDYLGAGEVYLDTACQSLRPRSVVEAINKYYTEHNSCGERVKYKWGVETDEKVEATRAAVLKFLKLPARKYTVSFTLNTTYGINLILSQLRSELFKKVMTSEIEHNSPFLATMAFAERTGLPREVMEREQNGSINLNNYDFSGAVVVVNCVSNFNDQKLTNINELIKVVHKAGGIVVIDGAQAIHAMDILRGAEADAICLSAHKLYAPSLGIIAWRDDLMEKMAVGFVGGGMVDDVNKESYVLSAEGKEHRYTRFESGLQAWGEIVGLGEALKWLDKSVSKKDWQNLEKNYTELYEFLAGSEKVRILNHEADATMSFYVDGFDSHLLGNALSRENIMARTGYFCAHYYLDHTLHCPPLMRFSLGLHNRPEDIAKIKKVMEKILY
jgi:selenocysteine lyase/cysteine desulfurase